MTTKADDFKDCRDCLCFAARRAARRITQHYDRHLRPMGLRATQFTLLATLAQTGPLPINRLAAQLGLDRTTLTRNLRPLEQAGWVTETAEEDRRLRTVAVTAAGEAMARDCLPAWRRAQALAVARRRELGLDALATA